MNRILCTCPHQDAAEPLANHDPSCPVRLSVHHNPAASYGVGTDMWSLGHEPHEWTLYGLYPFVVCPVTVRFAHERMQALLDYDGALWRAQSHGLLCNDAFDTSATNPPI